jgi:hypothetical protein
MSSLQKASIVELSFDYTIALPAEIVQGFRPADHFLVWPQGDMLILKRVSLPRVTEIVDTTPPTQPPLTMEEIDDIVHQARPRKSQE